MAGLDLLKSGCLPGFIDAKCIRPHVALLFIAQPQVGSSKPKIIKHNLLPSQLNGIITSCKPSQCPCSAVVPVWFKQMTVFGNLPEMELTRTVENRIGCLIERIPFYHIPVPEQNRRPCRSGFHDLVLAVLLQKGVLHGVMNVSFYTKSQY